VGPSAGTLLHAESLTAGHVPGGETFEFSVPDRWGTELYRRVPGNPEGY
jgi:hypothetical protein